MTDIFSCIRREIEIHQYLKKMILIFPIEYIKRSDTIRILADMIRIEYGVGKYDLPSIQSDETKRIFNDFIKVADHRINATTITHKISNLYDSYAKLSSLGMPAERIYMHPDGKDYRFVMTFNFIEVDVKIPMKFISKLQKIMSNSRYLPHIGLMYALRFDILSTIEPNFGVFHDLDELTIAYSVRKKRHRV